MSWLGFSLDWFVSRLARGRFTGRFRKKKMRSECVVNGAWLTVDEFLTQHLNQRLTHGISQDAAKLFNEQ